ncbi:MAG: hydroxyethylthiazole kinase [Lachnospirales bacterium]
MLNEIKEIFENTKKQTPIVHTITNYVTVNDCANIILASGASPIMSDEIDDIEEIIGFAGSLIINMGTLNKRTVDSMIFAGKKANALNIPVVLDPVGLGATTFRNKTAEKLLKEINFSIIKGNVSELKFMATNLSNTSGVDASEDDMVTENNMEDTITMLKKLAKRLKAIIVATGEIDIITDGEKTYSVKNGSQLMSKITGSGCMLGCVVAAFAANNKSDLLNSTLGAVVTFGIAGEIGEKNFKGTGSFRVALIDAMSNITYKEIEEGAKINVK